MEQLKSWKTRFGRFSKSTKVGVLCTWACPKVFGPTLVPTALGHTTRRIKTKKLFSRRFGQLNEYKIHRRNSTKCLKRRIKQELHNCGSNYY